MNVGDHYSEEIVFSFEKLKQFCELIEDFNPIHTDWEYASNTEFGKPIVHGMYAASLFSKVLGSIFPGPGTINIERRLKFLRPILIDEKYRMDFVIDHIDNELNLVKIGCKLVNVSTGKASICCDTLVKCIQN